MSPVSQLSPELPRDLLRLARALVAAARNWMLYPPEHPTVAPSVSRLAQAIQLSSGGGTFTIGVMPETLTIESAMADATQSGIAETAAFLHDRRCRPQVKILTGLAGALIEEPLLANTWERGSRGEHPYAVGEALDPDDRRNIDPLTCLDASR